jgi:hypothetical protein
LRGESWYFYTERPKYPEGAGGTRCIAIALFSLILHYCTEVTANTKQNKIHVLEKLVRVLIDLTDALSVEKDQYGLCDTFRFHLVHSYFAAVVASHEVERDGTLTGIRCLMESILLLNNRNVAPLLSSPSSLQHDDVGCVRNRRRMVRDLFVLLAHMLSHDFVRQDIKPEDRNFLEDSLRTVVDGRFDVSFSCEHRHLFIFG